jgi:hypothetical protein
METSPHPPSAPPPRPDAAARTMRREHRWLPTLAVAAIIVAVVLGGYVTADELSPPASQIRTVAGAVTVVPASGWSFVEDLGAPGGAGARFTRGAGTFDVFAGRAAGGDAAALARTYVVGSLEAGATGPLTVSPDLRAVQLGGGITGARLSYVGVFDQSGVPIEGEVTAAIAPSGAGVVFDGWAPQGQLQFVLDDVHAMEEGATFP